MDIEAPSPSKSKKRKVTSEAPKGKTKIAKVEKSAMADSEIKAASREADSEVMVIPNPPQKLRTKKSREKILAPTRRLKLCKVNPSYEEAISGIPPYSSAT